MTSYNRSLSCLLLALFALALPVRMTAQPDDTSQKISPKLRTLAATSTPLHVMIVLARQPQREHIQRANAAAAVRHQAALDHYQRLAGRSVVAPGELESAAKELDDVILAIRQDAAARIQADLETEQDSFAARLTALGGTNIRRYTAINMFAATIPPSALDALEADPGVARVFADGLLEPGLDVSVPALGADAFWNSGNTGAGQQVGILDTGISMLHPAFSGVTWVLPPKVFVDGAKALFGTPQLPSSCLDDDPTSDGDSNGHGTHVAGIVVSRGAGAGVDAKRLGVAPGITKVVNLKVALNIKKTAQGDIAQGCGTSKTASTLSDMLAALSWAVNYTSATVFNYSFYAGVAYDDDNATQFLDAVADLWDITFVGIAGNNGPGKTTISSPGAGYNIISVANVDDQGTQTREDDRIYATSSRGPTLATTVLGTTVYPGRRKPDIAAPGCPINSAAYDWSTTGTLFISYCGTSMAAPHISGAAALLRNRPEVNAPAVGCPTTSDQSQPLVTTDPALAVKALLLNSATDIAPNDPGMKDGWDQAAGWGYADLNRTFQRLFVTISCVTSVGASAAPADHARFFVGNVVVKSNPPFPFGNEPFRATITWNRHGLANLTTYQPNLAPVNPLSLALYDFNTSDPVPGLGASDLAANSLDPTNDPRNNVRQVWTGVANSDNGPRVLKVRGEGAFSTIETFALAFSQSGFQRANGPNPAISSCTQSPQGAVAPGSTVKISCTVTNTGDLPLFNVSYGIDLTQKDEYQNWPKAAPGDHQSYSWTVTIPTTAAVERPFTASISGNAFGETFSGSSNYVIPITKGVGLRCGPSRSIAQPSGSVYLVSCIVTNNGDDPALNTQLILTAGGQMFSQSVRKLEKGSVRVNFDLVPVNPSNTTDTVTLSYNIGSQAYSVSTSFKVDPCLAGVGVQPASATVPADGGIGQITVTAPPGCAWSAYFAVNYEDEGIDWVTFSPMSGAGNGVIAYQVTANTSYARSVPIDVGWAEFMVNQQGLPGQSVSVTISGKVTDANGNGIYGVVVDKAITDANGNYQTTLSLNANALQRGLRVLPRAKGYTFSPAYQTITGSSGGINFTGKFSFGVSGTITTPDGTLLPGALVTFALKSGSGPVPQPVKTDQNGVWRAIGFQTGSTYTVTPALAGYQFTPATRTAIDGASGFDFTGTGISSASGQAADVAGKPLAGVTITFTVVSGAGQVPGTVTTDSNGNFTQQGFVQGMQYVAAASKTGYHFESLKVFSGGDTNVNFVGIPDASPTTFTQAGRVVDGNGVGVPGITLTFAPVGASATTPSPVQTDANGNWQQSGFTAGVTWQVTPTKAGTTFTPATLTFTGSSTTLNFTATARATLTVGGKVSDSKGAGVSGVTMTFLPTSGSAAAPSAVQTDANGNWQQSGFTAGVTWQVTPSKAGNTFTPPALTFTDGSKPLNFTASPSTFSVSGKVVNGSGVGISGVTMTFAPTSGSGTARSTVQTDANGNWQESGFTPGLTWQVIPSKAGNTFTPSSLTFTDGSSPLNFTISPSTLSVSGQIMNSNGVGVAGATITFSASAIGTVPASVQTDTSGHWTQSGFSAGGTYTFTVTLAGVVINPASGTFSAAASVANLQVTATFTASGVVTGGPQGIGIQGVPVSFAAAIPAPGQVLTNGSGVWSQSGFLLGTTYSAQVVTSFGSGPAQLCDVTPSSINFSAPATGLNFAVPPVCNR